MGRLLEQKLSLSSGLEGPSMLFSMDFSQQRRGRVPFFPRSSLAFIVCSCFDDDHFVGRPVCRFDSQFSKNELQRGPFYVMDFFSMYEVCVIHPLRQAFGRPVLFQIVIR